VTHELLNLLKMKRFTAMPALIGVPTSSIAAPGDIIFSDDFNRVSLPPWTTSSPAVTGIQVNPSGVMNAAAGGNNPSFNLLLRIRVE